MSPEDTAAKILQGTLGGNNMTFSRFRQAMFDQHPEYLTDKEMHDVWTLVRTRIFLDDEQVTSSDMKQAIQRHEAAVDQAMDWLDSQEVSPLKERPVDKEGYHPKNDGPCHPYDEKCGGPGGPCRNHGGVVTKPTAKPTGSIMGRARRKMMGFLPRT